MSFKRRFVAAAATLTLVGGLGATGAMSANAATPPCGPHCIDLFSRLFGSHVHPNFVFDVKGGSARAGTPIILWRQSNSDAAEDFTVAQEGTVHSFFLAGLVSSALDLHYHNRLAYELQYSPNGAGTGLCIGVPTTAADGTKVELEPCGATSKTVWVDLGAAIVGFYVPLVNGSDTNFSFPFVLDYPSSGFPTDNPRPVLQTWNLIRFSNGAAHDNQLFGARFGVLP